MSEPRPLFVPPRLAPQLAPYWEGIEAQELRLPRCSICGEWEWYPAVSGPACPGGHYEWQAVSSGATVFTFTRVERPLLAAVDKTYVVGLVCPDDAPACRVVTRLEIPEGEILIGARAHLNFSGNGSQSFPYYVVGVAS